MPKFSKLLDGNKEVPPLVIFEKIKKEEKLLGYCGCNIHHKKSPYLAHFEKHKKISHQKYFSCRWVFGRLTRGAEP
jgi:hypothetical protein